MDINEPKILREEVLVMVDGDFNPGSVCIVTGAAAGIGRATAVAAAANNLMTVGLDIDEKEGKKTEQMAHDMGGQMVFIRTDLTRDSDIESAVIESAKLGQIKYLANIAGIQHIDPVDKFPMAKYASNEQYHAKSAFLSFTTHHSTHEKKRYRMWRNRQHVIRSWSFVHYEQAGVQHNKIWPKGLVTVHLG